MKELLKEIEQSSISEEHWKLVREQNKKVNEYLEQINEAQKMNYQDMQRRFTI